MREKDSYCTQLHAPLFPISILYVLHIQLTPNPQSIDVSVAPNVPSCNKDMNFRHVLLSTQRKQKQQNLVPQFVHFGLHRSTGFIHLLTLYHVECIRHGIFLSVSLLACVLIKQEHTIL